MDINWSQQWPTHADNTLLVAAFGESIPKQWADQWEEAGGKESSLQLPTNWGKENPTSLQSIAGIPTICYYQAKDDLESWRTVAHKATKAAHGFGLQRILWLMPPEADDQLSALLESVLLSNYQFLPYRSKPRPFALQTLSLWGKLTPARLAAQQRAEQVAEATCIARDLVNEPVITLTATELGARISKLGKTYGFETEVMGLSKIRSLKMGGLLAVNAGSEEPPSFSVLHYRPPQATDQPPVVLVGKGVVYDTGGLSLKPTANSMDFMKSDMAGSAAVIGAMCGIALRQIPLEVIALIPATDNRPGKNAYVPGDVIRMFDGTTVEVLNTDAEGRLILADALSYAKRYDPALVIDLATLTGSAVVAVGHEGIAMMQTAGPEISGQLQKAGLNVHERLVELPLWEAYGTYLRSEIADLKNIGGRYAGAITAGKFLEHFTDYPWVHLDIAGPAWLSTADSYRGKQGTGSGVRLLMEFLEHHYEQQ